MRLLHHHHGAVASLAESGLRRELECAAPAVSAILFAS
jgi:hypothetical protein